ncbi:heme exporter protein C [Desulfitispora alkaliphila]|uniref:cytochrome c biogenesis protein n=1 Tax=Desulfitispora alkaliphila TaxID=622674 RepID=UPI003D19CF02
MKSDKLVTILGWLTLVAMTIAIYMVFIWVPADRTLGVSQKIFYFHVASAWVGFFAFFVVCVASIMYLRTRHFKWDILAAASAEIGVLFTTIVLVTGPIWARSAWNTWWNWEPRLTTTLILWFIYLAYILIRSSAVEEEKKGVLSAVFGIIGFINVPIVFMSIHWWQTTLHPVVIEADRVGLPPSMLNTMLVSVATFTLLYFYLLGRSMAIMHLRQKVDDLKSKLREKYN